MYPDTERGDEPAEAAGATQGVVRCPPLPSASAAQQQQHCPATAATDLGRICITVAPFTGGPFEVNIYKSDPIEELKKLIARRLKVAKERIYLLYRESELVDGSVTENLLVDGSTVTLLPRAETGLINPKPEQSVMQALESLNEQQVNDFLSGAAPLNLTMRLGDHMMLIQLQLSTVNQLTSSHSHSSSASRRSSKSSIQISSSGSSSSTSSMYSSSSSRSSTHQHHSHGSSGTAPPMSSSATRGSSHNSSYTSSSTTTTSSRTSNTGAFSMPRSNSSSGAGLAGVAGNGLHLPTSSILTGAGAALQAAAQPSPSSDQQQTSKSSTHKVRIPLLSPGGLFYSSSSSSSSSSSTPPGGVASNTSSSLFPPPAPSKSVSARSFKPATLTPTVNAAAAGAFPSTVKPQQQPHLLPRSTTAPGSGTSSYEPPLAKKPKLDTRALAEASKNLTQTLKQLSSEVLTTQPEPTARQTTAHSKPKREEKSRKRRHAASSSSGHSSTSSSAGNSHQHSGSSSQSAGSTSSSSSNRGAIIESMHHHGKGVYSGTFSGTLNPALQDSNGQPKRDITTIVHILNDLLCAQYKAYSGSSGSSHHRSSRHHRSERSSGVSSSGHHGHHHHQADGKKADQTERELSEQQLNITRTKMEALKRIMEERRAKREARKQQAQARTARSYSTAWSVKPEPKSVDSTTGSGGAGTGAAEPAAENEQFLQQPEPVTA